MQQRQISSPKGKLNAPRFHSFTLANLPPWIREWLIYHFMLKLGHPLRYVNSYDFVSLNNFLFQNTLKNLDHSSSLSTLSVYSSQF